MSFATDSLTSTGQGSFSGMFKNSDLVEDCGGPSAALSSSSISDLIGTLIAAFEDLMAGNQTGSGGSGGMVPGSTSQNSSDPTPSDRSATGADGGSNLPLGSMNFLKTPALGGGTDGPSVPGGNGNPSGPEGGPAQIPAVPLVDRAPAPSASGPAAAVPSKDGPIPGGGQGNGSGASTSEPAKSVDGARAGNDTVNFKLENTSKGPETIALTNSQGQKFDEEHLDAGQSVNVLLNASDPNTKSMREQLENQDGSLRDTDAKIGESNIQDENGHAVTSNDISNNNFAGDYGTDGKNVGGIQMTFSDDKGFKTGDDTSNPAYTFSKDDPSAMKMAMDTAQDYTLAIG